MSRFASFAMVLVLCGSAFAQKPVAQLPKTYIDTTWSLPTGGTTWAAHTSAQLSSALKAAQPGDVIVLDAGVTYSGSFTLPVKSNPNNKWIYIVSSQLASLPAGTRVSPADAVHMAKLAAPSSTATITVASGANYWRLAGIEITANSNYPSGCPGNGKQCMTYFLANYDGNYATGAQAHHIYFDRVYGHGSSTQDLQGGIIMNWNWAALVDSYLDDIHIAGFDCVGTGGYRTTGPIKIVNNYISSSTENIMFGGSGQNYNPGVPSDIEIRNNYLYKPLAWVAASVTNGKMVVKNAFEVKSGQRILFDGNVIENVWAHGQLGFAIVLTVRTGQSGDFAVDNDITITNNVLKNVVSGITIGAADDTCGPSSIGGAYPTCHNAGSQARINIANNLILFYDPTILGGNRNLALNLQPSLNRIAGTTPATLGMIKDMVFQHNTAISSASTPCWNSIYFGAPGGYTPAAHLTSNVWILDNVLCKQPSGDGGIALAKAMPWPNIGPDPLEARFRGNVMYVQKGERVQTFPLHNYPSTVPISYVAPQKGNYQLATPYWTDTSDGKLAGIK